ncbi:hypothetical protein ACI5KX_09250 [Erythrobacter sp. GH1-10]|uniref:hypothetical protein n=1 Tax=Erythrobacter sp. GH1-10 TaxID=3349334 RepID=UPI00387808BA
MTKPDENADSYSGLRRSLIGGIGGITLLFLAGVLAGYSVATLEHGGPTLKDAAVMVAIFGMILAVCLAGWKLWPETSGEPIAPSTKRARKWMYAIIGFSLVAGMGFAVIEAPDANALYSNAPIGPMVAMLALVFWLVITPALGWAWWRNVDELEASAYLESSAIAIHAYFMIVPALWLASRAGWIPAQDPMIVFLIVTVIWSVAWLYRKYF